MSLVPLPDAAVTTEVESRFFVTSLVQFCPRREMNVPVLLWVQYYSVWFWDGNGNTAGFQTSLN